MPQSKLVPPPTSANVFSFNYLLHIMASSSCSAGTFHPKPTSPASLWSLVRFFLFCIQLHRLAYVLGVDYNRTWWAFPPVSVSQFFVASISATFSARVALPRVTGVAEERGGGAYSWGPSMLHNEIFDIVVNG